MQAASEFVSCFKAMEITELRALFGHHPEIGAIHKELAKGGERHVLVSGLHASARSIVLSEIWGGEHGVALRSQIVEAPHPISPSPEGRGSCRVLVYMADNGDEAQYVYADLKQLLSDEPSVGVYYFPTAHRRRQGVDEALAIQRTETLARLCPPIDRDKQAEGDYIVVTYPEAVLEETPAPVCLAAQTVVFRVGQTVQISHVGQVLSELGFQRVDFVYEPGQYAIRGGIVDIYSYSHDDPYRLDFFGDEIDSIREFDIESQLSKERVAEAQCAMMQSEATEQSSLFEYLPEETVFASNDFSMVEYKLSGGKLQVSTIFCRTVEFAEKSHFPTHVRVAFDTLPQPVFHKQFDLLTDDLRQRIEAGYHVYILSEQQKQTDRLAAIFESISGEATLHSTLNPSPISFVPVKGVLHEGFVDNGLKICCYTDHQIFERFHRVALTSENARRGKAIITLKEINQLQVGDYVVHSDHGIAKFGGLVTTTVHGKPQEMRKLVDKDNADKIRHETVVYSPYSGGMYGVPGRGMQAALNWSLSNNVEMKVKDKKKSEESGTTQYKKVSIIDNFTISGGYNFAADSLRLQNFSTSLRIKLTKSFSLNLAGSWDPYKYGLNEYGNPVRINELRNFPRFLGTGTSFQYTFDNNTFKKKDKKTRDDDTDDPMEEGVNFNMDEPSNIDKEAQRDKSANTTADDEGYTKPEVSWSFTINYSVAWRTGSNFDYEMMDYKREWTHNLSFSGHVNPTPKWSLNYSGSFDLKALEITQMTFSIVRDLHCWRLSASVSPFGRYKSYMVTIGVNASMLQDLKYEKRSDNSRNSTWF